MIYAIVTNDKKLAPRFSKADIFTFYNDRQEVIGVYKNPALAASGCAAKQSVIDLLHKMNCDIVIVRKIGEKTLARLLNAGFKVEQGNTRHNDKELLENARLRKHPLTTPEQGVKSMKSSCGHH